MNVLLAILPFLLGLVLVVIMVLVIVALVVWCQVNDYTPFSLLDRYADWLEKKFTK